MNAISLFMLAVCFADANAVCGRPLSCFVRSREYWPLLHRVSFLKYDFTYLWGNSTAECKAEKVLREYVQ